MKRLLAVKKDAIDGAAVLVAQASWPAQRRDPK